MKRVLLTSSLLIVAVVVAITMVACGSSNVAPVDDVVAVSATCMRGPTPTPPPTLPPGQRGTPLPPDLRPDSTRMAEIDEFRKQRYESTKALIESGCDPRNLPMVAFTHLDGLPPQTLEEALQRADLVVTAHVTSTTFTASGDGTSLPLAVSMLTVDSTLKGRSSREIILYDQGGPVPDQGGVIGIYSGNPVLLRGDEVLLLAQKRTDGDGYWSVYPVGKYYLRGGIVSVPDGSPCDWISDRSTTDVLRLVQASLSHDTEEAAQACDWSRFGA